MALIDSLIGYKYGRRWRCVIWQDRARIVWRILHHLLHFLRGEPLANVYDCDERFNRTRNLHNRMGSGWPGHI